MRCHAKLTTDSANPEAVSESLKADNVLMKGLTISTRAEGGKIVSEIDAESVSTTLSTLDDILRCQITSESLI